ncbi:hypothetical protein BDV18DRAFT_133965 [Aspergillus unguis]
MHKWGELPCRYAVSIDMNNHQIQPLPQDVAAKIKSSTSILNLNGVIVELAKNALDANARTVHVTVDYRRGGCVIEDDGDGIVPVEFAAEGGLGKAYHTSKLHMETVPSRKGCFLASLSSLALLTITSHHAQHDSTNTVVFHHSEPVARLTPAPKHHALRFGNHGTRVTVNDLFGNMPVRVKARSLNLQKPEELDRQWDDLKHLLIFLLVANDGLEKMVLSDVNKDRKLTIRPRRGELVDGLDLTRFSSVLSQAGLLDAGVRWHAVSATIPRLTIHAALSLVPSPSKRAQFISLGAEPVYAQSKPNILYSEVNRLFSMSDFGMSEWARGRVDIENRRSGPLSVNRWPMFYIRIESDSNVVNDELPEADRSLQRILDILTVMINEYLKEHKLRPRGQKRQRQSSVRTESPARSETTRQRINSSELAETQVKLPSFSRPSVSSHFGNWSRVKSANSHSNGPVQREAPAEKTTTVSNENQRPVDSLLQGSHPADEHEIAQTENDHPVDQENDGDAVIPWADPHTGVRHWVNSRTGQSVNVRPSVASVLTSRPKTGSLLTSLNRERPVPASDTNNMWLENVLENWKNPVFGRAERRIDALETEVDANAHSFHKQCGLDSFGVSKYRGKLRRRDLAAARVIGQVDRKFILVEMAASSLVLIDQHAADERCRVERLSQDFFDSGLNAVRTIEVDPIVVEIPAAEASLFRRQAEFFQSWGVEYEVQQTKQNASLLVKSLPALIAERCRTEPDQLISLIRAETWKRTENGKALQTAGEGPGGWVGRLAGCPQGILDMINSRACRTAIMFNDVLSVDECRELVKRLAICVFPFQCAHGRPSMVPLLDLRGQAESEGSEVGFMEAFKRWQS